MSPGFSGSSTPVIFAASSGLGGSTVSLQVMGRRDSGWKVDVRPVTASCCLQEQAPLCSDHPELLADSQMGSR